MNEERSIQRLTENQGFNLLAGGALLLVGLRLARLPALMLVLAGGYLLDRGLSRTARKSSRLPAPDSKRDQVDQASWESFPASDPPAFGHRSSS